MSQAPLEGHLDQVERGLLRGWVFDPAETDARISLIITADGELIGRVLANRFRPHLHAEGRTDGRHGFELHIHPKLSPLRPHLLAIRREQDGTHVPGSPVVLSEIRQFDQAAQAELAQMLSDADTTAEIEERLQWLAWQTETLLRARAEIAGATAAQDALAHHRARWGQPETLPPVPVHTALVIATTAADPKAAEAVRELHALGLDISLAGADLATPDPDLPALAHPAPWFASIEEVLRRLAGRFDVVALCDAAMAVRYAPLLREYQPQAILVLLLPPPDHEALADAQPDQLAQAAQIMARDLRAIRDADVTVAEFDTTSWRPLVPQARFAPSLEAALNPAPPDSE